MKRPFTLFTGQWADLSLERVAELASSWGYQGLEIACAPGHFDVARAVADDAYLAGRRAILDKHGLQCWALSNHLVGQAVSDTPDQRHQAILPERIWGDGDPNRVSARAAEEMKQTALAARRFDVDIVTGFTGSPIWHTVAMFPPVSAEYVNSGYQRFADQWVPILDVFADAGVIFALEVHPSEIAYDYWTTQRAIHAVEGHSAFAINFDPSHLFWQQIDPVGFIQDFATRIAHVDCKDTITRFDGRNGRLSSHLPWGDTRRGWDFTTAGRGQINWSDIFRALDAIGYAGPISVEWEDALVDREQGAPQALEYLQQFNVNAPHAAFDAAFSRKASDE